MLRENKVLFFARFLGHEVVFNNEIHGELRGIHMDGLLNLDVIEEWDNNTPIYKKWAIEDTKLFLKRSDVFLNQNFSDDDIFECVIFKD